MCIFKSFSLHSSSVNLFFFFFKEAFVLFLSFFFSYQCLCVLISFKSPPLLQQKARILLKKEMSCFQNKCTKISIKNFVSSRKKKLTIGPKPIYCLLSTGSPASTTRTQEERCERKDYLRVQHLNLNINILVNFFKKFK